MSDETIPQHLALRLVNIARNAWTRPPSDVLADMDKVLHDLDAISAPKDPTEVALEQMIGAYLCSPTEDDRVKATGMIRAAYREREEAVKALSDSIESLDSFPSVGTWNRVVRRLYGWDRDGR